MSVKILLRQNVPIPTYYENHRTSNFGLNFDVSAPPTFVNEFSNKLGSLNIKLVAA